MKNTAKLLAASAVLLIVAGCAKGTELKYGREVLVTDDDGSQSIVYFLPDNVTDAYPSTRDGERAFVMPVKEDE